MFRGEKKIELVVDGDAEKVVSHLKDITFIGSVFAMRPGNPGASKPYIGKVDDQGFKIWPVSKFTLAPFFLTVLVGRVIQDGPRVKIVATAKQGIYTLITDWFMMVGAFFGVFLSLLTDGDFVPLVFMCLTVLIFATMLVLGRVSVRTGAEAFRKNMLSSFNS